MSDDVPAPDQIPGVPHPRETPALFGHDEAQARFLAAFAEARLHHAWLITGPQGVGKATLAYRLARFLLATPPMEDGGLFGAPTPPTTLDIAEDHPVHARILAGAEPGLRVLTRVPNEKTGRMQDDITVDTIRKLAGFFHLSATDGGRRVVIVDAADELNRSASNSMLKMLEEPPANTTLFLLAHQPARLLPTIRSRCRTLRLAPLAPPDMASALQGAGAEDAQSPALQELAAGSVGRALRLSQLGGQPIYSELVAQLGTMPRLDRARALKLAEAAAQRGAEAKLDLLIELMDVALSRLARQGASGHSAPDAAPDEAAIFARLAPDMHTARAWADAAGQLTARLRHGRAVNLDPAALVLDTLIKLNDIASRTASAPASV